MKHLGSLCLIALLGLGCKREVPSTPEVPIDTGEIQISASSTTSLDGAGKANNNEVPSAFDALSSIGLYTQLVTDFGTTTTLTNNPTNARFNYATPVWAPQTGADRLRYHETDPILMFGYFPHVALKGSRLQQGIAPHLFDFYPAKDQTTLDSVKMSNLMWCLANNNGGGYTRQSLPIGMVFNHLMCRVSLSVRVVDSRPTVGTPTIVHLRNLSLGPNPNMTTQGQIGVKAQLNVLAESSGAGALGELLQTTEVGTVKWTDGGMTRFELPVVNATDAPTFVTDIILLPFKAVDNENIVRCLFDYPESNSPNHPFQVKIPSYTGSAVPPYDANGNKWRFGRNDHLKMIMTIDISSAFITLEASIAPWLVGDDNGLAAEPE